MTSIFHDMMHQEMEVYVDDIISQSWTREDHLFNLKNVFNHLKQYRLRLNPQKCVFGAKSGKLLGFSVSRRGIEIDPSKAKAIIEMPPPPYLT